MSNFSKKVFRGGHLNRHWFSSCNYAKVSSEPSARHYKLRLKKGSGVEIIHLCTTLGAASATVTAGHLSR